MASRSTVRQGRANVRSSAGNVADNKDSKGRRKLDGTPEKKTTPAGEGSPDDVDNSRSAIVSDEILSLRIKEEDLLKLREPKPPVERKSTPVFNTILVRKSKTVVSENPPGKCVTVLRPAPRDAPVKSPDMTKLAGPRFDDNGNILPHSILGDIDDFLNQAVRFGDLTEEATVQTSRSTGCLTVVEEKKKKRKIFPQFQSVHESNALKNWEANLAERRRQQNYLSRVLNKPIDQLVMNQAENYRKVQELRYLIDRTLPYVENGKGYSRGAEFWTLPKNFGGDLNGLHTTLTETEKGYPPAIEHVGVPKAVIREKGLDIEPTSLPFRKPWHRSSYLCNRVLQLAPLMDELDPHEPDIVDLEVVGNAKPSAITTMTFNLSQDRNGNCVSATTVTDSDSAATSNRDPLKDHPDVYPAVVCGPSVRFGGFQAQWTNNSVSHSDEVAVEARVSFEAYAGERTMSFLEIGNDGTTAVYYSWKKIPSANPFNVPNARVQRFYFNQSNGVVLPGDMLKFPFVFKSSNAGVYTEQWEFQTHPVVAGGAKLLVTLRGVALKQDKFQHHRAELEKELSEKQGYQIVSCLVDDLVAGIKTPERSRSPIDAYITDEELFRRKNPELNFASDQFEQLNNLYTAALPEEEKGRPWDLDVKTIRQAITSLSDEDDAKQDLLQQLNSIVASLSFRPFIPVCATSYNAGYAVLSDMMDCIVERDRQLRVHIGLPDKAVGSGLPAINITAELSGVVQIESEVMSTNQDVDVSASTSSSPAESKAKNQRTKEKKTTSKEGKQSPTRKEPNTPSSKGLKSAATSAQASQDKVSSRNAVSTAKSTSSTVSAERQPSTSVSVPADDPAAQVKYKNNLYTQTYLELCEMAEAMDVVLGELLNRDFRKAN